LDLVRQGNHLKTGGDHCGGGRQGEFLRLLEVVHGLGGADPGAAAAEETILLIQPGRLGNGVGKGNIDGLPAGQAPLFGIGDQHGTLIFTLAAADALLCVYVPGLLHDPGHQAALPAPEGLQLAAGEDGDPGVMGRGRHLRGGDTTGAIEGGKDLGEPDHLAADGGVLFQHGHGKILLRQGQGRLQPGDAPAQDQGIKI
jgi:hypothetical protein